MNKLDKFLSPDHSIWHGRHVFKFLNMIPWHCRDSEALGYQAITSLANQLAISVLDSLMVMSLLSGCLIVLLAGLSGGRDPQAFGDFRE